jgi:hypothetical protein
MSADTPASVPASTPTLSTPPSATLPSTKSTLRTVTATVLEAPLLKSFDLEEYRQWTDVNLPHYKRVAKADALLLHECIDIHTKKNFLSILDQTETDFDALSVKNQLAALDLIFSPYLESSQVLEALSKLKMLPNADLFVSYNEYTRSVDWTMRLAHARTAAVPSDKMVAKHFVSGLWDILGTRMKALPAIDLLTSQTEALKKCRALREASLSLDIELMSSTKQAPRVDRPLSSDTPSDSTLPKTIRCNRCGELGHYSSGCHLSYKAALCSLCGKHGHLAQACQGSSLPSGTSATQSKPPATPSTVTPVKAPQSSHLRFSAETLSAITTKEESREANAKLTSDINELKKLRKGLTESYITLSHMTIADTSATSSLPPALDASSAMP